jgi:DNA repair exonuclease SbcCD ATPase subunit
MCRYEEYEYVFDNLFKSIKDNIHSMNISLDKCLIILTGDIFHNKTVIGSYGLNLYKKLIKGLTSIAKTIVFHGNHDRYQSDALQPSLVSCTMEIDNLILLDETSSFVVDNVGFSYVSIDDTLDSANTRGRITFLPPFPKITEQTKYKVALFHGTFAQVKQYNGTEVNETDNPYPFEWINQNQRFDFALFGDIHLRQYGFYGETMWGYSGSLVQQNYAEDPVNHGYMIWDLDNRKVSKINVYNSRGLINLKTVDDEINIKIRGYFVPFAEYIEKNKEFFPKHIDIKLHSEINIEELFNTLAHYGITCNITNAKYTIDANDGVQTPLEQSERLELDVTVDKSSMLAYFQQFLSEDKQTMLGNILRSYDTLLFNLSKYPEELHDECKKKNKDISQLINACMQADDIQPFTHRFVVKYLEWKNIYCYEDVQWIDFSNASHNTFLVAGNNGTGKSAIYDVLTLAIWGDITTSKQNTLSAGIINYKHKSAYAIVELEMNGIIYRVYRTFTINDGRNRINKAHNTLYKYNEGKLEVLKKENACNEEVLKLFGTMNDFLTTSMITQNVDFDILKMDYKSCLAVIDKTADIDFIYHLYNLFKGCLNKYKDFKKVIESKKEVYQRLMLSHNNLLSADELNKQNELIASLTAQKTALQTENNSIAVDISNPKTKTILKTDYNKLIKSLGELSIKSEKEYNKAQKLFNELMTVFKGYTEKQGRELLKQYDPDVPAIHIRPEKPCDYSIIEAEQKELAKYKIPPKPTKDTDLQSLKDALKIATDKINDLNDRKPVSISKPKYDINICNNKIKALFQGHQEPHAILNDYCSKNNRTKTNINKLNVSYNEYLEKLNDCNTAKETILKYKTELSTLDILFKQLHIKQQALISKPKPDSIIPLKDSRAVKIELDKYDIQVLEKQIADDEAVLNIYYNELERINNLEKQLQAYENELAVFNTSQEYKYNKRCKVCMQRPWVSRLQELEIIIKGLKIQIKEDYDTLYEDTDYDYMEVHTRLDTAKDKYQSYNIYNAWYTYYAYKEASDGLVTEINHLLATKDDLQGKIKNAELSLSDAEMYIQVFNTTAFELFELYNDIQAYNLYSNWKIEYDALYQHKHTLECDINHLEAYTVYETTVKPRLNRLQELQEKYNTWYNADLNYKKQKAYELHKIKESIDAYSKYKEYTEEQALQPLIKRKIEIIDLITDIDKQLGEYNEIITKNTADMTRHVADTNNFNLLTDALSSIDSVIELIEAIIATFKDYRKELYDTHILRKVVNKANQYIKSLCHTSTKMFEIDYLISEVKDVIHIHWLIRNMTEDNNKQTIAIQQASGFQQFAISMALRMSLFSNKRCQQLFIDEGFTACDKLNLSIVPGFLKALLKSFHSIIIVSHIDVIQDTVDHTAQIKYNESTKASTIRYGSRREK